MLRREEAQKADSNIADCSAKEGGKGRQRTRRGTKSVNNAISSESPTNGAQSSLASALGLDLYTCIYRVTHILVTLKFSLRLKMTGKTLVLVFVCFLLVWL